MSHNARAVDAALAALPLDDRIAALVTNILTRRPDAIKGVLLMIAATVALTRHLSHANKIMMAECLRDAADETERRKESVRID